MKYIKILILFSSFSLLFCETFFNTYGHSSLGDSGYSLLVTSDSSLIISGYTNGSWEPLITGGGNYNYDPYILKVDCSGNLIWDWEYSTNGMQASISSITERENNYYATCNRISKIFKLDPLGNTVWEEELNDFDFTQFVNTDEFYYKKALTLDSLLLVKYDSSGVLIWEKCIADKSLPILGHMNGLKKLSLIKMNNKILLILHNPYCMRIFVVDGNGILIKEEEYLQSGGICKIIKQDDTNYILICNYQKADSDLYYPELFAINDQADSLWMKNIFITKSIFFQDGCILNDSCFVITGRYYSNFLISCFDFAGNMQWQRIYGHLESCKYSPHTIKYIDNWIYIVGEYEEEGGNKDIFLVKTDSLGIIEVFSSIKDENFIKDHKLYQNYPNPFNPATTLSYGLPEQTDVQMIIFDLSGRKIQQWSYQDQTAGAYEIMWDGKDQAGNPVPSGVYIYYLIAGNFVESKKMVLLK